MPFAQRLRGFFRHEGGQIESQVASLAIANVQSLYVASARYAARMSGVATIASGFASAVVSTALIVSSMAVLITQIFTTASHAPRAFYTNSVVANTSFLVVSDANAGTGGIVVGWMLVPF